MNSLYYGDMFGWGFEGIMMLIFWIAILLFIILAIKGFQGNESGKSSSKSAADILKERYAKGEIDKKEFEEKKKDITNS